LSISFNPPLRYKILGGFMGKKLYVGNLAFSVSSESLTEIMKKYGTVESAKVITDRDTGRSKGFAFVEMSTDDEASKVIAGLNGQQHEGRAMNVSEAKPQVARDNSSRGGRY
jgi:RNA recognition motif-containing protein